MCVIFIPDYPQLSASFLAAYLALVGLTTQHIQTMAAYLQGEISN